MRPVPRHDAAAQASGGPGIARVLAASIGGMLRLPRFDWRGWLFIAVLVAIAWLSTAISRVEPGQQGVVMRLGKPVDTVAPGLHVHLPYPIETVRLSTAAPASAGPSSPATGKE